MFPWCPNLSWVSARTVYFQDFDMTRARNFCSESVICLYSSHLTWVKSSVSCLGAFPLDKHLEIHLQKGSVFCIWRRSSNPSDVKDFGIGSGVDMTPGVILGCAVEVSGVRHCWVWLQVLKAGPSVLETDSILIGADGVRGSSTRWDRQSAALFLAADIHSNVML